MTTDSSKETTMATLASQKTEREQVEAIMRELQRHHARLETLWVRADRNSRQAVAYQDAAGYLYRAHKTLSEEAL